MADLSMMQNSIDFIEENLKAELTLTDIASHAGFSPFHFCRIFQRAVGMPVMAYVLRRRLVHAAHDIACGKPVTGTALTYGFDTHAGFYKAFVREFDCSPAAVRNRRPIAKPYRIDLRQGDVIMMAQTRIKALLKNWGHGDAAITPVVYENSGITADNAWYVDAAFVFKATENLTGLKTHAAIAKALEKEGLCAPAPVKTTDGREYVTEGDLHFYLLPRLAGRPVNSRELMNAEDCAERARRLGVLIGQLHKAFEAQDGMIACDEPDLIAVIRDWAMPAVQKGMALPAAFLAEYMETFQRLYQLMPRHIIHRDPNPSNILMLGEVFTGFIDFELGERNIRLFDPCYLTTAILSETFPESESPSDDRWFEIYHSVLQGYDTVCPLAREEREAAPYVVFTIQMICAAYFSSMEKFQGLAETNKRMLYWLLENREQLQLR